MNREFELRYTGRTEDGREFVRVSHPDFPERHPDHDNGGYVFCNDDREILYREQRYPWPTGSVWDAHYGYAWPVLLALPVGALVSVLVAALGVGGWAPVLPGAVLGALLVGLAPTRRNRKRYAAGLNAVLAGRKAEGGVMSHDEEGYAASDDSRPVARGTDLEAYGVAGLDAVSVDRHGTVTFREQSYPRPRESDWDAYYGYAWPVFLASSLGAVTCLLAWLLEGDWGAGLLVAVLGALLIGLARVHRNRRGYAAGRDALLAARKAGAAPEESGRRAEMRRCAELGLPYLDYDTGRIWTPEDLTVWQERDGERRRKEAEIRTRLEVLRVGEAALRSKYRPRDEFFYPHLWADNRRSLEEITKERDRLTAALESLDRPK